VDGDRKVGQILPQIVEFGNSPSPPGAWGGLADLPRGQWPDQHLAATAELRSLASWPQRPPSLPPSGEEFW